LLVGTSPLHISLSTPNMSSLPPKIKLEEDTIQKKSAPMPLIAFDDDSSISDSSVKAVNGMDVQDSSSMMMRGITSECENLPKKTHYSAAASSVLAGSRHVRAVKLEADAATDMKDAAVEKEIAPPTKIAIDTKEEVVAIEEKTTESEQGKKPKVITRDTPVAVAPAVPIYSLLSSDEDEDTDSVSNDEEEAAKKKVTSPWLLPWNLFQQQRKGKGMTREQLVSENGLTYLFLLSIDSLTCQIDYLRLIIDCRISWLKSQ
jgi:hypothetical protein